MKKCKWCDLVIPDGQEENTFCRARDGDLCEPSTRSVPGKPAAQPSATWKPPASKWRRVAHGWELDLGGSLVFRCWRKEGDVEIGAGCGLFANDGERSYEQVWLDGFRYSLPDELRGEELRKAAYVQLLSWLNQMIILAVVAK